MRIVFMGTPEFAVSILEAIHQSQHEVAAVITAPDKPAGRGRKLRASAVKDYALKENLKLLQPLKLKDPEFLSELEACRADLFVVVAFRMLPKEVWQMPAKGTINLHASLLPQYRGAAPINWAIVNGESETGLSTFYINENIDTGDIIQQASLSIGANETAGSLHDRMMRLGQGLVLDSLASIESNQVQLVNQSHIGDDEIKYAPKIFKEDLKIDWSKDIHAVHNLVRGMSPFPGAWSELLLNGEKQQVKIYQSLIHDGAGEHEAQSLYTSGKKLFVAFENARLEILELQLQGKKRMKALDFLNGQQIDEKARFS